MRGKGWRWFEGRGDGESRAHNYGAAVHSRGPEPKLPLLASRAPYLHLLSVAWVIRGYHNQALQR